jgi:hypothetical protein
MKKEDLVLGFLTLIVVFLVIKVATFDFASVEHTIQKEKTVSKEIVKEEIPKEEIAVKAIVENKEETTVSSIETIKDDITIIQVAQTNKIVKKDASKETIVENTKTSQIEQVTKNEQFSSKKHFEKYDGLVVDNKTNLMWQDTFDVKNITKPYITSENFYLNDFNNTKGDTAFSYCEKLTINEFSDFRLPSIEELKTLVNKNNKKNTRYNVFEYATNYNYWSSTPLENDVKNNWYLYTTLGTVATHNKSYNLYVRCVRDN